MIETEDCLQKLTERTFYGVSDCEELGVYKNEHLVRRNLGISFFIVMQEVIHQQQRVKI